MPHQKFCELIMAQNKNKAFQKFCISKEIAREFTVPEKPEQKGLAERFTRAVVEVGYSDNTLAYLLQNIKVGKFLLLETLG